MPFLTIPALESGTVPMGGYMFSRSNHPLKKHLPFPLFVSFPLVFALVLGACGKTEQTDMTETSETVVVIRKPIPTSPVPLTSEKAETKKQEIQEPSRSEYKKPDMPSGSIGGQGLYRVRKGDSLASIAERSDVYDNPLKWTSLFRLNLEKFEGMKKAPDFENHELPEGLHLKFVTTSQAQENIKKLGKRIYAVNVLSKGTTKKITPCAITLIRNGYNAYICPAIINDKEWIRLRAGFFKNRTEATEVGNQITSLLDGTSVWVVKISQTEINDYCGDG